MNLWPSFNKNFFIKWLVTFLISITLLPIIVPIVEFLHSTFIYPSVIKNTYIAEIKGDPLEKGIIKDSLDYYNKMGNNNIVKYEKPNSFFARPVTIEIVDFKHTILYYNLAGQTAVSDIECTIKINGTNDPTEFKQVLIHEYNHCMGWLEHSPDSKDIMFAYYNEVLEENIRKYAKELEKKMK